MFKVRKSRVWISLGLVALIGSFTAVSATAGLFRAKAHRTVVVLRSLAVFPIDQSEEMQVPATLGQDISAALRSVMGGNKKYSMILYKELLAPIERGRIDAAIKLNEDKAPFAADPAKPLKLARLLAVDCFVVGSIDECQVAVDLRSAQLTISMDLVDAKSGKVMKTIVATGRTPEGSSVGGADEAVALAAGDVVNKLMAQILELAPENDKTSVAPIVPVTSLPSEAAAKPKEPAAEKKPTEAPSTTPGTSVAPTAPPIDAADEAGADAPPPPPPPVTAPTD
ncbi:MAG: hypothetical protein NT018_05355 [Armatimonadetes bacterium]|nr:hypothetical protein [Armatimonadota bacterium]